MANTTGGPDGGKQKLSPAARRAKQARDKSAAMTTKRKRRKKENQATGKQSSEYDLHHTKSGTIRRTSIAYNRATHTRGEV